jgi:hypothetical protein
MGEQYRQVCGDQGAGTDPQAKEDHTKSEHAKNAEHRGVAMVGSKARANLEIRDDGQVDEEAKDSGTHEIPNPYRDEKVDGPFLVGSEWLVAVCAVLILEANEVPRIEREEGQRPS